jgi:hypothetical protein
VNHAWDIGAWFLGLVVTIFIAVVLTNWADSNSKISNRQNCLQWSEIKQQIEKMPPPTTAHDAAQRQDFINRANDYCGRPQ